MGAVYEAIDERVNCLVAIKQFLKGDPGTFKREAELLANLRHPSLPRVTDHFSVDQGSFLVMDFIPGNDLEELLRRRGSPFPVDKVLGWAGELLKVLEYLHKKGVLHRDFKPSNVKLTGADEIFLLDFGLAKGAVGEMFTLKTNRSVPYHTLAYASLEQCSRHRTDARSDLYSLGATLYNLLTNVLPIDAPTRNLAINDEDPDPLRLVHELNPQVSPAVSAVIHQAMAIRRKERPESAAEMRRLLSEASRIAPSLTEEEKANEERRQRKAEEEERRTHEEEEARRRRAAANTTPPVIPQPDAPVPPTQKAPSPVWGSDVPPQIRTLQTPPQTIFQPVYTQSASPIGTASHTIAGGGGKSRLLWIIAALLSVAAAVVLVLVIDKLSKTTADNAAQKNPSENVPANITNNPSANTTANTSKATPSPTPLQTALQIEMVLIPSGTFMMGSSDEDVQEAFNEAKRNDTRDHVKKEWFTPEVPRYQVTVQQFYMGKYEVTQEQWQAVMGNNPSYFKGCGHCPVDSVSWDDAQKFISKLNAQNDGYKYRLPSEAEWEYACRAGTTTEFAFGNSLSSTQANFDGSLPYGGAEKGTYRQKSTPVGMFKPNAWGLYDMHGNMWEWCEDWYHDSYNGAPVNGSAWLNGGQKSERVLRGGAYDSYASTLRSASRHKSPPILGRLLTYYGFRVAAVSRSL